MDVDGGILAIKRLRQAEVQDLNRAFRRHLMLAGFRSRWMTPFSCAYSSPSAIYLAICRDSSIGSATPPFWRCGCSTRKGAGPESGPCATRIFSASVGPLHQLHHQGAHAARFFQAIDRCNVGMIERRQHLSFALEACHA